MKYLVAALAVVLVGCETAPISSLSYTDQKKVAQEAAYRCFEQGIRPDSPEIKPCVLAELRAEDYRRAQNLQSRRAVGQAMMAASASQQRTVHTSCNRFGTMVNCTSY